MHNNSQFMHRYFTCVLSPNGARERFALTREIAAL